MSPSKSNDEISELGERINFMILELRQRFELQKFVSNETMDTIKQSDDEGVKLGGERKYAAILFSDIRGFTRFLEQVESQTVIEMLNTYLHSEAEIVKKHNGDVDKYAGDEIVAVFQGKRMLENAARCAIEIQKTIPKLNNMHKRCASIGR